MEGDSANLLTAWVVFQALDGTHLQEGVLSSFPLCPKGVEVVWAVTGLWLGVLGAPGVSACVVASGAVSFVKSFCH